MSITVNGYTLNDVGEAADWSPVEVALLSAFAALHPAAGTTLCTDEHLHSSLYFEEAGDKLVDVQDGLVLINQDSGAVDTIINDDTSPMCKFDSAAHAVLFYQDKKIECGSDVGDPEMAMWTDGTNARLLANLKTWDDYDDLAEGEIYTSGDNVLRQKPYA